MMQFYSDIVKSAGGEKFRTNLFRIADMSKTVQQISCAASNAVSILNAAQINLGRQHWSGVRIPEANLFKAFLSGTDLRGADLTGVNLTSAYLKNANFEKATMKDVNFGVFPNFKCGTAAISVAISRKGSLLACGLANGNIQIWDYNVSVRQAVIAAHTKVVSEICFSHDGMSIFSFR